MLRNKSTRSTVLIDIAVPETENTKRQKYENLSFELKRIWNQERVSVVPIVLSFTGIVPGTLCNNLKELHLSPNLYITMPKTVILQTYHIVRRFLNT